LAGTAQVFVPALNSVEVASDDISTEFGCNICSHWSKAWKKAKPCVLKGEILEVSFPHPRDRSEMRNSKKYYELRNYALNFLERNFTTDD
jgi:hypothetical protein